MHPKHQGTSVRRSLALFLAVVFGLALWQLVLSWRLMQQDSNLAERQKREHLEQIADLAVSQIVGALGKWELTLRKLESLPPSTNLQLTPARGKWLILLGINSVSTYPRRSLLFVPATPTGMSPSPTLDAAEKLEFQDRNYQAAIDALRPLADKPPARAEALLRLARIERKLNHLERSLRIYDLLAKEAATNPDGIPYPLLAAGARCEMLPDSSCSAQLRAALLSGHWQLRRETFEFYWAELNRWQKISDNPPKEDFEFSLLITHLYDRWLKMRATAEGTVTREMTADGSLLMCDATQSRLAALFAAPGWRIDAINLPASARDIQLRWIATEPWAKDSSSQVVRSLAEAGLNGKLDFSIVPSPVSGADKRSLWFAGVGLMLLLVLGGAYATYRGVSHELRLVQLQSDFMAAVSHEFRSPLTSLLGITELLSEGRLTEPSQLQRSFTFLQRETARLQRLLEDLLDFGRMESGQKPYRREIHDAFGVVRSAVEDFKEEASGRGFHLELDLAAENAGIEVDRQALRTALRNLLENAVKYSLNCRTVWVEGRVRTREVAISVRDRGIGIAPVEQRDIFERFVRGTEAKIAGIKGTGIGLSMVRQIVHASGGEIQLESSPGIGSTFTIVLPLASQPEKGHEQNSCC
ncbi:MAG: HAMP domain-containing sensor histidine kinase [Bryobacteraceae bacterium]